MLLDRHRIVGAALHRRVVGDDHHLRGPTRGRCRRSCPRRAPRRRTGRRRRAGRSRGTASRDRAAARRARAAAACRATTWRSRDLLGAALGRLGDVLAQLLGQRAIMRGAGAALVARQVDLRIDAAVRSSLPKSPFVETFCRPRVASPMRLAKRRRQTAAPREKKMRTKIIRPAARQRQPRASPSRLQEGRRRAPRPKQAAGQRVGHRPGGDGQVREAGRRFLRLRQRQLDQERPKSRPTVERSAAT